MMAEQSTVFLVVDVVLPFSCWLYIYICSSGPSYTLLVGSSSEGNGATMPGADEAFPAESRTTLFFGAVTSKSEPLTFEESLRFVKKVKARNYMLYLSLFDILGRTELSQLEAYQTLQLLFRDHPDLHEGLEKFRPPMPTKHAAANSNLWPWVFACAAVPLVAMSLIPALGNPVLWLVQQTLGEKMRAA
ncbi:hypothetical protein CFC21_033233 [Triticum aestivum]|uniref:Uncharacterized protein n=2 Tax=Triticum aestivum TaxID=4565 RepID=A0A9R1F142_WHEAT|nr:hypothetical protein CFC21_033233 [Triticum aestivum]